MASWLKSAATSNAFGGGRLGSAFAFAPAPKAYGYVTCPPCLRVQMSVLSTFWLSAPK